MSKLRDSKKRQADFAERLIAGTQKHLANGGKLTFAGSAFTPSQVIGQLHEVVELRADAEAARAVARAKVAAEEARLPALRAFLLAFAALVKAQFGALPDVLADFGMTPNKTPRPLTPEEKAAAKAKRAATRKARGVIGSRKRAAIKGDVTGVIVTPLTGTRPADQTPSHGSNGETVAK